MGTKLVYVYGCWDWERRELIKKFLREEYPNIDLNDKLLFNTPELIEDKSFRLKDFILFETHLENIKGIIIVWLKFFSGRLVAEEILKLLNYYPALDYIILDYYASPERIYPKDKKIIDLIYRKDNKILIAREWIKE